VQIRVQWDLSTKYTSRGTVPLMRRCSGPGDADHPADRDSVPDQAGQRQQIWLTRPPRSGRMERYKLCIFIDSIILWGTAMRTELAWFGFDSSPMHLWGTLSSAAAINRDPPREYWMIYRGPSFLTAVWLNSSPTPSSSSPLSKLSLFISLPVRRRSSLLAGEGGREWASSQIIRPWESLALYKLFNTLYGPPCNTALPTRRNFAVH
jgi:hypothetical protein